MESDRGQSSRRSVRLPGFDYSKAGMYFVTICAAERQCSFGEIRGNDTFLSPIGQIVRTCWIEIPKHFPNIRTETYVVMPNHVHGILIIPSSQPEARPQGKAIVRTESFGKPTPKSIPTAVRSFKSASSRRVRESGLVAGGSIWQRGYYEHVLRNTREYVEATNYILLNPARWADDEDNPDTITGADNP